MTPRPGWKDGRFATAGAVPPQRQPLPPTDVLLNGLRAAVAERAVYDQIRRARRRAWLRRWVWVLVGLTLWTGLVVLWATTPSICTIPAARTSEHCQ